MGNHPLYLQPAGFHGQEDFPADFIKIVWQPPLNLLIGQGQYDVGLGCDSEFRYILDSGMDRQETTCKFHGQRDFVESGDVRAERS